MNKILVVADHVDASPVAIEEGVKLAELYSAKIHAVYFCFVDLNSPKSDVEGIKHKVLASVRSQVETTVAKNVPEGTEFSYDVVWCKQVHKWVNDYVAAEKPCLVVKRGNRSESLSYTPTDWHILRECGAPVFISPKAKWRKTKNVLAAIDLETKKASKQALNHAILAQAKWYAEHYGVELHVCYSPVCPPILADLGIRFPDEAEHKARKALASEITALAEQYGIAVEHFHIHAGLPEKVIPSIAAKYKASLVVMGVIGRRGIAGKLMGNTAEKVLSLLKADILALKPSE